MKKLRSTIIILALFTLPYLAFASDPPDPGSSPQAEPPLGGGAPIGGGLFILLGFSAVYGVGKIYKMKNLKNDIERDERA